MCQTQATAAEVKRKGYTCCTYVTFASIHPSSPQGGEAVGAGRRGVLLRAHLHPPGGDGARAHQDVLQEGGVPQQPGGDPAHDLRPGYDTHTHTHTHRHRQTGSSSVVTLFLL